MDLDELIDNIMKICMAIAAYHRAINMWGMSLKTETDPAKIVYAENKISRLTQHVRNTQDRINNHRPSPKIYHNPGF